MRELTDDELKALQEHEYEEAWRPSGGWHCRCCGIKTRKDRHRPGCAYKRLLDLARSGKLVVRGS